MFTVAPPAVPHDRFSFEERMDDHRTKREFEDFIMRINIYVCITLTTLVMILVFWLVKREQAPVIYYINLLTCNLIQFIMILYLTRGAEYWTILVIFTVGWMVCVYFRMIIAMERCFVITRPKSNWIRQTGWSVLVSVLVWILCITTDFISLFFSQIVLFSVFALLPAPLFIFFLAWTFKALPAATSVPTDEKRRIVGTLVLLFIQYFLIIFFLILSFIGIYFKISEFFLVILMVLFLLSPYVDLILAFFMWKGPTDKLRSCLCCCITDNSAEDVAGYRQLHELMLQQEREREKVKQTV